MKHYAEHQPTWKPISSVPKSTKVLLRLEYGTAIIGQYYPEVEATHWCGLPTFSKESRSVSRERDIIAWATERGIFDSKHGSSKKRQADKTQEELNELFEAIECDNVIDAMDAIGDIMVTLAIQAHMWNLGLDECIEAAYQEIKDRKGQMVDGLFVKEA